jgi:putative flavoprotein involved in K+ transport
VWCTGFEPDFDWVRVPGFLGGDGWPAGSRGVVESAPGSYFLGIPFQFGFSSMLVGGAGRDAQYVVERIAERARAKDPGRLAAPGRPIRPQPGRSRSAGPM